MGAYLQDFVVMPKSTCWKQRCTWSYFNRFDSCSLFHGGFNSRRRERGPFLNLCVNDINVLSHFVTEDSLPI